MNDSVPVNYEALSSRFVFILDTILANNSQQGKYDQCDYLSVTLHGAKSIRHLARVLSESTYREILFSAGVKTA